VLEGDQLLAETVACIFAYLEREQPWRRDALCREPAYSTAQFFPERGEPADPAKAVCARCAVAAECAAYALSERVETGIWGGLSGRERHTVLTGRKKPTGSLHGARAPAAALYSPSVASRTGVSAGNRLGRPPEVFSPQTATAPLRPHP